MGWLFGSEWQNKADLVKHLCEGSGLKTLAKAMRGNTLWAVQETADGQKIIACYLMGKEKGCGWGYKGMDESMGPSEVSCPLNLLDMVPCPGGYATGWRERVKKHHERLANLGGLKVGVKVKLRAGCKVAGEPVEVVEITSVRPLRARMGFLDLKLPKRLIAEVLP